MSISHLDVIELVPSLDAKLIAQKKHLLLLCGNLFLRRACTYRKYKERRWAEVESIVEYFWVFQRRLSKPCLMAVVARTAAGMVSSQALIMRMQAGDAAVAGRQNGTKIFNSETIIARQKYALGI